MTVSSSTAKAGPYAGAGLPGPFTVPFRFLAASHLQVIKTSTAGIDAVLTLTTDYTVAGVGAASGSVTLTAPLAVGERLTIIRNAPFTQLADYVNNDAFPAESHEDALDLLTMQTQQLKERSDAALTLPATVTGVDTDLPTPESNKLIGWNQAGDALQNFDATTLATIVAFGTSRADVFTGNGVQTQFALTANPGALASLDVAIGGVTQTPGVNYTYSGTTLTFVVAPPLGAGILARYFLALPQGVTDSAASTFLQAGAGSVTRTVQEKLRDVVSVRDFGAVGNGVADDTAAIQVALTALSGAGVYLYFPPGRYPINSRVIVPTKTGLIGDGSATLVINGSGFTNINPDVYETSTSTALQFSGGTSVPFTPNEDQKLVGICIEGNFAEGRSCNAVAARNCKNIQIEDNKIFNFKHTKAIIVASLTGAWRICGNHIYDCVSNTVFASHPTFADRGFVNITGIDIDDDAVNGATSDAGLVAFNRISNLRHGATAVATYGDQADGIYQNKGNGLCVIYNRIEAVNEGIDLLGNEGEIAGNHIANCGNFGIKLIHGATRNRVHHNTIVRSGIAGIWVGANVVVANGNTEWNEITDNVIREIDPSNTLGASTTGCIKVESTGGGVYGRNNTFARNYCDPGAFGQYAIINNSTSDTGNVFDKNAIRAPGTLGTYLVLAANNFEITPRIPTRVLAYPSAAQAIATGTMTKVALDLVQHDTALEYNTANRRWVCAVPGFYRFEANITLAACRLLYVALRKNNVEVAISPLLDFASDSSASAQISFVSYMSVADYMEVWVQHGSAGNRNLLAGVANSWFTVSKE